MAYYEWLIRQQTPTDEILNANTVRAWWAVQEYTAQMTNSIMVPNPGEGFAVVIRDGLILVAGLVDVILRSDDGLGGVDHIIRYPGQDRGSGFAKRWDHPPLRQPNWRAITVTTSAAILVNVLLTGFIIQATDGVTPV